MHPGRFRLLRQGPDRSGPVFYWMHREHRAADNWGLLWAQKLALARGAPLAVAHCLDPAYPGAALRHFVFLLAGLRQTEAALRALGIPLLSCLGDPAQGIPILAHKIKAAALVLDFDPLRHKQSWGRAVAEAVEATVWEADSRNIVPCRQASDKKEWAARTLRPKIHRLLPEYLEEPPALGPHPHPWPAKVSAAHWDRTLTALAPDPSVPPVDQLESGEAAAARALDDFVTARLPRYADKKNDPNAAAVSLLSPYLHFGQPSSLRAALAVSRSGAQARDVFLEELIVRRELADNFCLHKPAYDRFQGFPDWARRTPDKHRHDRREYVYGRDELEAGQTHDPLWNAAQLQMTATGHMHGWLRMYCAKKKSWSGRIRRKPPRKTPWPSTTAGFWTAATPTATRASPGAWSGSTTGPGASGRCSARCAS